MMRCCGPWSCWPCWSCWRGCQRCPGPREPDVFCGGECRVRRRPSVPAAGQPAPVPGTPTGSSLGFPTGPPGPRLGPEVMGAAMEPLAASP